MIKVYLQVHTTFKCLKEPRLITQISFQVSKDDRSDIESSSEEETETTSKERLKTAARRHLASPRGENGTNGHFGSKSWSQNHSDWWHSLHVVLCTKNSCPRNIATGLFLIPVPHSNTKNKKHQQNHPVVGLLETRWQSLGCYSSDNGTVMTIWPL